MHYPVIHANPVIWVYRYWDRCLRSLNRRIIAKESKQSVTILYYFERASTQGVEIS